MSPLIDNNFHHNSVFLAEASLTGTAEYSVDEQFNPKALWGPISGRFIPATKKTLSRIFAENISNLSREEYEQLRYLIEYIATNPESKQRVFELTGFNDNDLAFAEKYFRKYSSRKMFSKLVGFALSTSSNGKVSKQIGGLIQFIFETGEINGEPVADDFKYKLLTGIPQIIYPIWDQAQVDCSANTGICASENKLFLDLNGDSIVNQTDIDIAHSSLDWITPQLGY